MSILISQIIPSPPPSLIQCLCLYLCVSISALQIRPSIPFSRFYMYVLILYLFLSLWLTLLCKTVSRPIHISVNKTISFFLWLSNLIFHLYHIFFIDSSVDGHLGCVHVLAIINSATVNTGTQVLFWIMVFSGYMPVVGFLDHMVVSSTF